MTTRQVVVAVASVLLVAGCSGGGDNFAADRRTAPATTTATTTAATTTATTATTTTTAETTTAATGDADRQVCAAVLAIEARGFQTGPQELLQIAATGSGATTLEIVTDSAFLAAAATAGDVRSAGDSVLNLLESCRQYGYI